MVLTRRSFVLAFIVGPLKRSYHHVAVRDLGTTTWTHVETRGLVTYVRKQQDGDWHITLEDAKATAVLEIIPAIPLPVPAMGRRLVAWGISRFDRGHSFAEIHPLEGWRYV